MSQIGWSLKKTLDSWHTLILGGSQIVQKIYQKILFKKLQWWAFIWEVVSWNRKNIFWNIILRHLVGSNSYKVFFCNKTRNFYAIPSISTIKTIQVSYKLPLYALFNSDPNPDPPKSQYLRVECSFSLHEKNLKLRQDHSKQLICKLIYYTLGGWTLEVQQPLSLITNTNRTKNCSYLVNWWQNYRPST